jgi:hypothetical protein
VGAGQQHAKKYLNLKNNIKKTTIKLAKRGA